MNYDIVNYIKKLHPMVLDVNATWRNEREIKRAEGENVNIYKGIVRERITNVYVEFIYYFDSSSSVWYHEARNFR